MQAGLRNAEPVFVAVPGRLAGLLRERLGAESPLLRYGAMTETGRNPARLIPELHAFLDEHPGQRVRYIGESIWPGRSAAELCEATRHEALLNLAFATAAVSIMCPYDVRGLADSVVGGVQRTHPAVLRQRADPACHRLCRPGRGSRRVRGPVAGAARGCRGPRLRDQPAAGPRTWSASYGAALGMAADADHQPGDRGR